MWSTQEGIYIAIYTRFIENCVTKLGRGAIHNGANTYTHTHTNWFSLSIFNSFSSEPSFDTFYKYRLLLYQVIFRHFSDYMYLRTYIGTSEMKRLLSPSPLSAGMEASESCLTRIWNMFVTLQQYFAHKYDKCGSSERFKQLLTPFVCLLYNETKTGQSAQRPGFVVKIVLRSKKIKSLMILWNNYLKYIFIPCKWYKIYILTGHNSTSFSKLFSYLLEFLGFRIIVS